MKMKGWQQIEDCWQGLGRKHYTKILRIMLITGVGLTVLTVVILEASPY